MANRMRDRRPVVSFVATDLGEGAMQMSIFAYLDPGSGSMLLQILVGGIAGVGVVTKYYGRSLWRFISPEKPAAEQPAQDELQPMQTSLN